MSNPEPTEVAITTLENEVLDASEVNAVAHEIESHLMGRDIQTCVAALIALAIVNMREGFEKGDLGKAVYDVSQFIMTLDEDGASTTPEGVS